MPPTPRLPLAESFQGLTGPVEAVTARMFCARPSASAGPNYQRLFMDPAVELWLRPSPMDPFSPADIDRLLRHDRSHWQIHGFGPWSLTDRDTGEYYKFLARLNVSKSGLVNKEEGPQWVGNPTTSEVALEVHFVCSCRCRATTPPESRRSMSAMSLFRFAVSVQPANMTTAPSPTAEE